MSWLLILISEGTKNIRIKLNFKKFAHTNFKKISGTEFLIFAHIKF